MSDIILVNESTSSPTPSSGMAAVRVKNSRLKITDDTGAESDLMITGDLEAGDVTELRGIAPTNKKRIYLKAHTTEGDGGHGWFRGVTAGTYTDNGGTIIVPGEEGSAAWLREYETLSVLHFGAARNGTDSAQTEAISAVAFAYSKGERLEWPDGTYLTTENIPHFHGVRHVGDGVITRGIETWAITRNRTTMRKLYVSPSGDVANDGLSVAEPMATIQAAVEIVHKWGPVIGRQQIIGASGTYAETVFVPEGLATERNYLEFKFPSDPGVQGDPSSWPAGGAILDGRGLSGIGWEIGRYNRVYVEYLLLKDWYDTGLPETSQVIPAMLVREFAQLYVYGVSGLGNGYANIYTLPFSDVTITGGNLDGARFGVNNTGANVSFTANNTTTYTTIKNALEYGLYSKHQASTVLDYTRFDNCGNEPSAADYGSALFAYKTNTSIDTRGCVFTNNNIVYNARGGYISTHPSITDVMGSGAEANARIWKVKGFGANDLINYRSKAPRELSVSDGGNSTIGAVAALVFDTNAVIPKAYLINTDQHVEIEMFATNAAGGTAQVRPSFVSGAGTRYELGNFQIAASTNAHIRLIVQTSTGGTVATVWYATQGATIGGITSGFTTINPVVFDSDTMEFQVWGETSAGNQLSIRKTRVVLWG